MDNTVSNGSDGYSAAGILAVAILLIAGCVVIRSLAKKDCQEKATGTSAPPASGSPGPPSATQPRPPVLPVPVVFAAVVRASQARTAAGTPEQAADLFHGAAMRWTGPMSEWSTRERKMGLRPLTSWSLEGDDRVIATYRAELPCHEIPHNFLGIQRSLNKLASDGSLKRGDLYGRPVGIDPSRFGFKEF